MSISKDELKKKLAADRAAIDAQTAIMNAKRVNANSGLEGLQQSQVPGVINRIGNTASRLVDSFNVGAETLASEGGLVSKVPQGLSSIASGAKDLAEATGVPAAGRFVRDVTVGRPDPIGTPAKSLQTQSVQRTQAAAGTAGTTTGDSSGTGANTFTGPVIPSSSSVEGVNIGQTPQGLLSISDQAGGTGAIQFKDQRKLGQESLDRLAGVVKQNADPAFQQRLAQEAALSQSRYDAANAQKEESDKSNELLYFKRAHLDALRRNDLVSVSQFANRIKELEGAGLARELAGSKAAQESEIASNRIGFDLNKTKTQQALEAGKQQDQLRTSFFKMLSDSEKAGTSNPLTNYSAARSAFGDNVDRRVLHAALGNDVASSLIENRGNLEEQVPILQRLGFPEQDAQYILNQINQ